MKALALLATTALVGLTTAASAGPKHHHYRYYSYAPAYVVIVEEPIAAPRRAYRVKETHDDVRANAADPSGDYAGYPSWARAALAGGSRRR